MKFINPLLDAYSSGRTRRNVDARTKTIFSCLFSTPYTFPILLFLLHTHNTRFHRNARRKRREERGEKRASFLLVGAKRLSTRSFCSCCYLKNTPPDMVARISQFPPAIFLLFLKQIQRRYPAAQLVKMRAPRRKKMKNAPSDSHPARAFLSKKYMLAFVPYT
jgi:hypothetical protein